MPTRPGLLLALLNTGLGVALLLGDPQRTSSPSFSTIRELMPIHAWAVLFLLGGLVCALAADHGRRGAVLVGIGAGIHAYWATALLTAALDSKSAALTGIVVYTWAAVVHVLTARRLAQAV